MTRFALGGCVKGVVTVMTASAVLPFFKGSHGKIISCCCASFFHCKGSAVTAVALKFKFINMGVMAECGFGRGQPYDWFLRGAMACHTVGVGGKSGIAVMTASAKLAFSHGGHGEFFAFNS